VWEGGGGREGGGSWKGRGTGFGQWGFGRRTGTGEVVESLVRLAAARRHLVRWIGSTGSTWNVPRFGNSRSKGLRQWGPITTKISGAVQIMISLKHVMIWASKVVHRLDARFELSRLTSS